MKNKSAVCFALGFCVMLSGVLYAASGVRGAKGFKVLTQSTTALAVATGPTAVYSIVIGTGAVTDYVVLLDSANATAATVANQLGTGFRGRFYPSSATQNTAILFDPPLQFNNGVTAIAATALGTYLISYELGRVTQGY